MDFETLEKQEPTINFYCVVCGTTLDVDFYWWGHIFLFPHTHSMTSREVTLVEV